MSTSWSGAVVEKVEKVDDSRPTRESAQITKEEPLDLRQVIAFVKDAVRQVENMVARMGPPPPRSLPALATSADGRVRTLRTTSTDVLELKELFENTGYAMDFVMRFYFRTTIVMGADRAALVSYDGRYTPLRGESCAENVRMAVKAISQMPEGSSEYARFKKDASTASWSGELGKPYLRWADPAWQSMWDDSRGKGLGSLKALSEHVVSSGGLRVARGSLDRIGVDKPVVLSDSTGTATLTIPAWKWPSLVGATVARATVLIEASNPTVRVIPVEEGSPVTKDYRLDRVRVFYDASKMVATEPRVG